MTLSELIDHVRSGNGSDEDWLLIAGEEAELSLSTDCELAAIDVDEENDYQEILPEEFKGRGLRSTIDYQTLQDCIAWAERLSGKPDAASACEIILYYLKFDSFPKTLGAPDPPSTEEIIAHLDKEFYDSLGQERQESRCRNENCFRGAVLYSAFCRVHHFENVKKRSSPFSY